MKTEYYELALVEFDYLNNASKLPKFNNINAVHCHQVCEKLLKAVMDELGINTQLIMSHNLLRLYEVVDFEISIDKTTRYALAVISDFYIDGRYPTIDHVNVNDEYLNLCFTVMNTLMQKITAWFEERETKDSENE